MFKFSYNWLKKQSEIGMDYDLLLEWLLLQGFEIASIEDIDDDKLIEIEVKANRPDMLCVEGVLREYYASQNKKTIKELKSTVDFEWSSDKSVISKPISIASKDVLRYCAAEITGIDNTVSTPDFIKDCLHKMGVASINCVVDISNFVLLLIGQPIHVFDTDKVDSGIYLKTLKKPQKMVSLAGTEIEVPEGAIMISDKKEPLCVAGIIGAKKVEVDTNTKNVIIESANFCQIASRMTAKAMRISTLSSYRFERGVSPYTSQLGARLMAQLIHKYCGGTINKTAFIFDRLKDKPKTLKLRVDRVCTVLGVKLTANEIAEHLSRCFFEVEVLNSQQLKVTVPYFRLDIELDVDLIEEVGRIYGYHNIEPQPMSIKVTAHENPTLQLSDKLRSVMTGFGFIEVITYGFIPEDSCKVLNIKEGGYGYGDINLLNPLSNLYSLMRPTMAHSLISTAIMNMAKNDKNLRIFEVGKTYVKADGEYKESNVLSVLMTGQKLSGFDGLKGKFNVFDLSSLTQSVLGEVACGFEIENTDKIGFFETGAQALIKVDGQVIGCLGKVSKSVLGNLENGKLAKDDVLFMEFCFDGLIAPQKGISFERIFPSVTREYNFVVPDGVAFKQYKDIILRQSEYIKSVTVLDVFYGKGVESGTAAVLLGIEYNADDRTLQLNEIEQIEEGFKAKVASEFNIVLKS